MKVNGAEPLGMSIEISDLLRSSEGFGTPGGWGVSDLDPGSLFHCSVPGSPEPTIPD